MEPKLKAAQTSTELVRCGFGWVTMSFKEIVADAIGGAGARKRLRGEVPQLKRLFGTMSARKLAVTPTLLLQLWITFEYY